MPSPEQLLAAAQQATDNGQKETARQYLDELVKMQPENEQAWLLLARNAPDVASTKRCLERVLLINARHPQALAGMEWVRKQEIRALRIRMTPPAEAPAQHPTPVAPTPPPVQPATPPPVQAVVPTPPPAAPPRAATVPAAAPAQAPRTPITTPLNVAPAMPPAWSEQRTPPADRPPGTDPPAPRSSKGTGPLSISHQVEHTPAGRPGFSDVPLYPNGAFRALLFALGQVTSRGDVTEILLGAGLDHYVGNYPPADADPEIPYSDYSAFGRALERFYGERAVEVQVRIGERIVNASKPSTGVLNLARNLVPPALKIRRLLESMVRDAQEYGVPTDWEETADGFRYIVALCPYCFGRRTDVGCNAMAGVLAATIKQATGKNFQVTEVTCRGRGDDTCSYEIALTPLD